jgi:hypothetical protein
MLFPLNASKIICAKAALLWCQNVGDIDTWCQFHQHFMSSYCAKILSPKNYKAKLQAIKICAKKFGMTANFTNILQALFSYQSS